MSWLLLALWSLQRSLKTILPRSLKNLFGILTQSESTDKTSEDFNCEYSLFFHFSSVQSLSRVRLFVTPWTAARQASLSITNSQSLFKLMSIETDAIQPSHPLSSPSLPTFNLSQHHGLFQLVSSSHQVAKVLQIHLSISPSNEYSGLISFRINWFDLLAVQGTLKSFLQHHISKACFSALSFLHSPTLISTHNYGKNHSFD